MSKPPGSATAEIFSNLENESAQKGQEPDVKTRTGIWLVREEALALGEKLRQALNGDIYKPWEDGKCSQRLLFKETFPTRSNWVLVMTTGIAVRFLDGLTSDKTTDPAVVVVDEGGHHAISLLSGHEGGANELTYKVSNVLGAMPVISTATEALKPLILGIGCRKGVSAEQIDACVHLALGERKLSEVRLVASIDLKAEEPGLLEFCRRHKLPLQIFARESVASRPWSTEPSDWVRKAVGSDGVCEPCALMASPRGRLIVPKTVLNGVAAALVEDELRG